jgi:hypothetical protein
LASARKAGIETPSVLAGFIPNLAIPATFLGLAIDLRFLIISLYSIIRKMGKELNFHAPLPR